MKQKIKVLFNFKKGISIGLLFSILSFIAFFTVIPVMLSVFFGGFIELITSSIYKIEPYNKFATLIVKIHLIIFILSNIYLFIFIKNNQISKISLTIIFIFFYLLNHSFADYLYWQFECNFCGAKDGQLIFRFFDLKSNTLASSIFLIQGIVIELLFFLFKKLKIFNDEDSPSIENNYESKVDYFVELHKEKSIPELEKIINNPEWTLEAREAMKRILESKS